MASFGGGPSGLIRRFIVALAVPIIVYMLYATGRQAVENQRMAHQAVLLQGTVHALEAENVRLQNELMFRRGDAYVEQIAREQLGLVMPGDTAIHVALEGGDVTDVPPQSAADDSSSADSSTPRPAPVQSWLQYFFGG